MRECPCSTKTREVLGNPSRTPERFPETREISRGRSPREISRVEGNSRDFPRSWVLHPETRGKSRGSRGVKPTDEENLEGGGDGFPNTSRVLVEHGHSLIITREGLMLLMRPCCWGVGTAGGQMLLMCRCCLCGCAYWCVGAADVAMLLMRQCCWCKDAADAKMPLMCICCCCVVAQMLPMLRCCCCVDARMLPMCWWYWSADAAEARMLLKRWCCWNADAAEALILQMRKCYWYANIIDVQMLLICQCCWCTGASDALKCRRDTADMLMMLMHQYCRCADTLMLLMPWCCGCPDAADPSTNQNLQDISLENN